MLNIVTRSAAACAMIVLSTASLPPFQALAQTPPPTLPPRPGLVPLDPERQQAFQAQEDAFRSYQKCVAEHRKELDLHSASRQIVEFRNNRAMLERALQADPRARERVPGGVEEALARVFAQYKSFGGTAASVADVAELPNPCPAPNLGPPRREPVGGSSPVTARRELVVPPGTLPAIQVPTEPPRVFTPTASPPLRRALEQAWLAHVYAVRSGKEGELEKTMSSYYYAMTKNRLARGGALTPDHIALHGRFFPDLNRTRFVTVIEKGATAALVHAKDSTMGDSSGKPGVEYHFFRFVDEGRGWKADGWGIIHAPKYQDDGSPAPFRLPANPHPDFKIDGQIRRAPAPLQSAR